MMVLSRRWMPFQTYSYRARRSQDANDREILFYPQVQASQERPDPHEAVALEP
jgi:hypothetical protein